MPLCLIAGLDARVEELISKGHRPSTARTYASIQHRYLRFCNTYQIQPLPASELHILRFIAHISHNVSYNSMQVYLSAIRALHVINFLPPPPLTTPRIALVLKALAQSAPEVKQSLPITFSIMKGFMAGLSGTLEDCSLWACMTSLFFGVRRAGELVPSAQQIQMGDPIVKVSDLMFVSSPVLAALLTDSRTKTQPKGCTVIYGCSGHQVCPYCAFTRYMAVRGITTTANNNQPLFVLQSGAIMTKEYLVVRQKSLLVRMGLSSQGFTPHSYRSGAATQMALNGVPEFRIQKAGLWRSGCYKRYIRDSVQTQAEVASLLVPNQ